MAWFKRKCRHPFETDKHCKKCGHQLKHLCQACGYNGLIGEYCGSCGTYLSLESTVFGKPVLQVTIPAGSAPTAPQGWYPGLVGIRPAGDTTNAQGKFNYVNTCGPSNG